MHTHLEELSQQRAYYKARMEGATTENWRARMAATYWVICRLHKAERLGIPHGQLAEDDDGDVE